MGFDLGFFYFFLVLFTYSGVYVRDHVKKDVVQIASSRDTVRGEE